jgi:beta-galactosidase
MKKLNLPGIILTLSMILTAIPGCKRSDMAETPRTISFDQDWRFLKDNPSGAENISFDDSKWRSLDLPHDWSIEDLPGQKDDSVVGPFSKASVCKQEKLYHRQGRQG